MRATAGALLLLCGCQTYDFEPVTPLGIAQTVKKVNIGVKPPKPNVFLVVDKSGSMDKQITGTTVTRMTAMKSAMGTFLTQSGSAAHLGMLPFPSDATACAGGDLAHLATVGVPLDTGDEDDARLAQVALTVKGQIDALTALGGTPTGATMASLATYTPLLARDTNNFAVLLTDGLPNCNDALQPVETTCACTQVKATPTSACSALSNGQRFNQCLDDTGSAAQISLLRGKGVRTIVIGFGDDIADPAGGAALATMAASGGFARPCTTAADCNPGDTCNAGGVDPCGRTASTCGENYFKAGTAAELGRVLDAIAASVQCAPCLQTLNVPPSRPEYITVMVDGLATPAGPDTWVFHDDPNAPTIEFQGAMCGRLMGSTTRDPVKVEIRTVEAL